MSIFSCQYGQSYSNVVLNTYGTLDKYVQFLDDNNLSPEDTPVSGQQIYWDETQVVNQNTSNSIIRNKIIYSTLEGIDANATDPPIEPIPPTVAQSYKSIGVGYTATTDNETVITVLAIQGAESIVQIEKELKPLTTSDYVANLVAGTITLIGGKSLMTGESLFIIYNKLVTL